MRKLIAFGWYGGKFSHLSWLLPLLPECGHYCEPFGGSAAVLLNRDPSPCETYNDIDSEVVTFFRVCRDNFKDLERAVTLTPFSREEYEKSCVIDVELPDLEKARRFYVRARQVYSGLAQAATLGKWAKGKNISRMGMHQNISKWMGGLESLPSIAERLLRVQIENVKATYFIKLYDSSTTLFYCDPPYVHSTREKGSRNVYSMEMTDDEHRELSQVLHSVVGKVVLSNYDCELMGELYHDWRKIVVPSKLSHVTNEMRTEVVWLNY